MKTTGKACDGCGRGAGEPQSRDGVQVMLCPECQRDWFRRERVYTTARGEKWDPVIAGRPTR